METLSITNEWGLASEGEEFKRGQVAMNGDPTERFRICRAAIHGDLGDITLAVEAAKHR